MGLFSTPWFVSGSAAREGERPREPRRLGSAGASPSLGALLLLLVGTAFAQAPPAPAPGDWQPKFRGVDYVMLQTAVPRPLRAHVLRVDLRARGISFTATPSVGVPEAHTVGRRTSSFLMEQKLQAAVNAAPFAPVLNEEGKLHTISGLTVRDGKIVSPPSDLPAILITRRNKVTFAEPPFKLNGVRTAVAGFAIILRGGENIATGGPIHPRTAAGTSADGRTLYLVVIDGRQKGYSEGVTTQELAEWLRALGATDGINLDGGGTSSMVVEGADGLPVVLNTPIHLGVPGTERPSASNFGLRARKR